MQNKWIVKIQTATSRSSNKFSAATTYKSCKHLAINIFAFSRLFHLSQTRTQGWQNRHGFSNIQRITERKDTVNISLQFRTGLYNGNHGILSGGKASLYSTIIVVCASLQVNQVITFEITLPKDLLMLAWNAKLGYSFDKTLSHPFVAQAGTRSHWDERTFKVKSIYGKMIHWWYLKCLRELQMTLFNRRIMCLCLQCSFRCLSRWWHLVPWGSLASKTCRKKLNKNKIKISLTVFFFGLGAQEDDCLRNCQKGKCMINHG